MNNVGDYKISAQNASHGQWLMCDGMFVHSDIYPKLFATIGYSFGSFSGYPLLFALPNATDRVIGMEGTSYSLGDVIGNEEVSLSTDHLPSHSHFVATSGYCEGRDSSNRLHLSEICLDASITEGHNYYKYAFGAKATEPNAHPSSKIGNGDPVNVVQPTIISGNLFIWAE